MNWEYDIQNTKPGVEVRIPHVTPEMLRAYGYYESTGLPKGQLHDWRKALPDGRGIHVKIYRDRVTAHMDRRDPSLDPVGHLLLDAPGVAVVGLLLGIALLTSRGRVSASL